MQIKAAQTNLTRGLVFQIQGKNLFFTGGPWIVLGITLTCFLIFLYQLYIIVIEMKLVTSVIPKRKPKAKKVKDENTSLSIFTETDHTLRESSDFSHSASDKSI
jgi:hypothetical protein